jgi:hypothetical protein
LYAPDGPDEPNRADGTDPRHLSLLASARKPWSADNSGSGGDPHRTHTARSAPSGASPGKDQKDVGGTQHPEADIVVPVVGGEEEPKVQ